ncbi:hypothetical protein BC830DRAFT_357539 [Chytriomyces sp. MP71]|nr:hypothetical protein BC830DRAFT_357539 [Chytriomyces sp. MP71]
MTTTKKPTQSTTICQYFTATPAFAASSPSSSSLSQHVSKKPWTGLFIRNVSLLLIIFLFLLLPPSVSDTCVAVVFNTADTVRTVSDFQTNQHQLVIHI